MSDGEIKKEKSIKEIADKMFHVDSGEEEFKDKIIKAIYEEFQFNEKEIEKIKKMMGLHE